MKENNNNVADIIATLKDIGVQVTPEQVEEKLKVLEQYRVRGQEARRNAIRSLAKEAGFDPKDLYKGNGNGSTITSIGSIAKEGQWIAMKVKVVQLWDSSSEKITQTGLIGDSTGIIKFTLWESAGLLPMEEGKCYHIQSAVTASFNGRFQVNLNKNTTIMPLAANEDIDVKAKEEEFTGAIVGIQSGSGLIKRCPECNRQIKKGSCGEHGKVEGIFDLRTKAVLDNGIEIRELLLNAEMTAQVTGITLEKAKQMATEALDQAVVEAELERMLVGHYYTVKGSTVGRYLLVNAMTPAPMPALNVNAIAAAAEAI